MGRADVETHSHDGQIGGESMECPMADRGGNDKEGTIVDHRAGHGKYGDEAEGGRSR